MATVIAKLGAWTPAQIAALVFGAWWMGNGITVFLATQSTFSALGADGTVNALGVSIAVNGWHGLYHLTTGLAGLALCWRPSGARAYALIVGLLYLVAALFGLFVGETVFGLIRVDEFGSVDHAVEGVLLLVAWFVSPTVPAPAVAAAR